MPQTNEGVLLFVGAIFFLIGLLGGGFEVSGIKIPSVGKYPRILSLGIGAIFMGIAVTQLIFPPSSVTPTITPIAAITPTPLPPISTIAPTETPIPPTNTPAPSTSTPTPLQAQTPTFTLAPSATPTLTETSTPIPPISLKFHTISLNELVNASTQEGYVSPPLGQLEMEGILFDLPTGRNSVTTQAKPLPNFPTILHLTTEIYAPKQIYLLITGGNIFSEFLGKQIGAVKFYFAQGEPYSIPLIAGQNIREWKLLDEVTVSTTSSSEVKEVWRSKSTHEGTGVIDLLTIDLPDRYQSDYLVAIEVVDSSTDTVGSMDPAINLIGATVLGY